MALAQIFEQCEDVNGDFITATPLIFVYYYIKDIEKIKYGTFLMVTCHSCLVFYLTFFWSF